MVLVNHPNDNPGRADAPLRNDVFTLPNALSVLRLLIGIAFPFLSPSWRGPAIVVGAITDLLDGSLSRYCGMASRTGRVLDPIADKTFLAGIVITLLLDGILGWGELLFVAARDLVVIIGTLVALATRNWGAFAQLAPTMIGKLTTAAQFIFLAILVLAPSYRDWLFGPTAVLSIFAALHYFWLFLAHRKTG
jgi:phosphatidylglycerophosphate synthase